MTDGESVDRRDDDALDDVMERLEWADRKEGDDLPDKRWLNLTRRTALSGGAAGLATFILQACGGGGKKDTTTTADAQDSSGGSGKLKGSFRVT